MVRIFALTLAAGLFAGTALAKDVVLKLPQDYKNTFENYLIVDRQGQKDQVMSMYANDIARKGAKTTGKLPYGSVLIGEVYKAKKDGKGNVIKSRLGNRIPDTLAAIVVMERRKGWDKQYPEALKVGDWEFEVFSPAGKNLNKDTTGCRKCHHPLKDIEYTFSYAHVGGAN